MAKNETLRVVVSELTQPTRLDRVLRDCFPNWGRKAVQNVVNAGQVKVNGRKVWLGSWKVNNRDRLEVSNPPAEKVPPPVTFNEAWVVAEEKDLIVINKPAGLLSHTTRWRQTGNLLDLATARFGKHSLFHRLDRDTSGVVLLSRNGSINHYLDHVFKKRLVEKEYLAVVGAKNNLSASGVIQTYLDRHPKRRDMMAVVKRGGKYARTRYEVLGESGGKQVVRLWPETGRTHQLRVQLLHMSAPILGDRLYGTGKRSAKRLMLHAHRITLPALDDMPERVYQAALPNEFRKWKHLLGDPS